MENEATETRLTGPFTRSPFDAALADTSIKRVAIYIRVSTPWQSDDGFSLEAQERVLRAYSQSKGYAVVQVYADKGISGKDIRHRPGMLQLLEDVKTKAFDIVLVWKLTRFTRSLSDLCKTCDMLDKYGITFVSYSESFDCSTPTGRMMRNILGVIAQWEREVIAENVRAAMDERILQGWITFNRALGYDVHRKYKDNGSGRRKLVHEKVKINKRESAIVQFIKRSYLTLKCIRDVVKLCHKNGYRGKNGRPFTEQSIYRILTRPLDSGYMTWHDVPFKSDKIPHIISTKEHNQIQRVLEEQGKKAGRQRINQLVYLPEEDFPVDNPQGP